MKPLSECGFCGQPVDLERHPWELDEVYGIVHGWCMDEILSEFGYHSDDDNDDDYNDGDEIE